MICMSDKKVRVESLLEENYPRIRVGSLLEEKSTKTLYLVKGICRGYYGKEIETFNIFEKCKKYMSVRSIEYQCNIYF